MLRSAARLLGLTWMLVCGVAWLSLLFWQPLPRIDDGFRMSWTVLTMLSDAQYGLGFIFILAGAGGFWLWRWGGGGSEGDQ